MANSHELRNCPTRTDGADALFAHKVTQGTCQDRQRNRYHKCYTCAFNNVRVSLYGLPQPASASAAPKANGKLSLVAPEPTPLPGPGFVEIA